MTGLAWLHHTRIRQRNALAIISAAFAALVLTFSLIIGQGVPGEGVSASWERSR